jgi:hypothetical protein
VVADSQRLFSKVGIAEGACLAHAGAEGVIKASPDVDRAAAVTEGGRDVK